MVGADQIAPPEGPRSSVPSAYDRMSRGGCGIVREYEILAEEATMAIRIDGV